MGIFACFALSILRCRGRQEVKIQKPCGYHFQATQTVFFLHRIESLFSDPEFGAALRIRNRVNGILNLI
jgi:hypothetical protein